MATIKRTIEEKAKAYDEAIEKLRSLHDDYDTVSTLIDIKEELENIFPELKSKDERIRKALIWHLTKIDNETPLGAYHRIDGIEISDMLAWLEKQGEQNPAWSEEDEENFKGVMDALNFCNHEGVNPYDIDPLYLASWLKSIKDRYTWKPSDEQMHYLSWIANIKLGDSVVEQEVSKHLNELLEDLKKLK